ncbi:hypothetical protein BDF22DRAFT_676232 [Syncephalis plumigaleata]|nr:hypothetical protein BDF22DRAFT_676232 [Syncephalis plumigaleata]
MVTSTYTLLLSLQLGHTTAFYVNHSMALPLACHILWIVFITINTSYPVMFTISSLYDVATIMTYCLMRIIISKLYIIYN